MKEKAKKNQAKTKYHSDKKLDFFEKNQYWLLLGIIFLSFIIYFKTFSFEFLSNWDDNLLVTDNQFVKGFSDKGLSVFYTFKVLNHDPITLLSHAITYYFWKLNPAPYHVINVILHLINIFLVFILIKNLSRNYFVITIVTALFALHPFRVESVAWVAERKDLLYSLFYLLSLICYIQYSFNNKGKYLIVISFLAFLMALLSKFSAITLPAVIVLIDWFKNRRFTIKVIIEKLIWFIPSIVMIFLHFVFPENVAGNKFIYISYNWVDRIFISSYSLFYYIYNAVLPLKLLVINQYPEKFSGMLPIIYYVSAIINLILLVGLYFLIKKTWKGYSAFPFGVFFFLINISIVLHFVPFGGNIVVGERYTYIAHIGLFFFIANGIVWISENNVKYKNELINGFKILIISGLVVFAIVSYQRTKVWKNGVSLFTDAIQKFPESDYAHFALGCAKSDVKDFKGAIESFNRAIQIKPWYVDAINNRGKSKFELGLYQESIQDYDLALSIDSTYAFAYYNKANALAMLKNYIEAQHNLDRAIHFNPNFSEAYNNRGNTKAILNDIIGAIKDFEKAIQLSPNFIDPYVNLGLANYQLKNFGEACNQWHKAVMMGSEKAVTLYNRHCNKN